MAIVVDRCARMGAWLLPLTAVLITADVSGQCQPACQKMNIECVGPGPRYDNHWAVCLYITPGDGLCTGWIVASGPDGDCVLTNRHCVTTTGEHDGPLADVVGTTIDFEFECTLCNGGACRDVTSYTVTELIHDNIQLDYALLKLDGRPSIDEIPAAPGVTRGVLRVDAAPPSVGEGVYEIHHAEGEKKGYDDGAVTGPVGQDLCLQPATEFALSVIASQGASGAPIFRTSNDCVVGICHCGPPCDEGFGVPMSMILPDMLGPLARAGCTPNLCEDAATGACCLDNDECGIATADDCAGLGGVYQGDDTECLTPGGDPTVLESTPDADIPDAAPNGISDTITVAEPMVVADVDVDLIIEHSWVGDLCVTLEHDGTVIDLIVRPGDALDDCHEEDPFGCPSNDYDIILDDEGTGGSVESLCATDDQATPTSPPSYTPDEPLSTFDGMDAAGDWTITVSDNAALESGVLVSWSLHLVAGVPACVSTCPADTNGDNVVDVQDLTAVILDWGCNDPPGPCPGDVTGNGVTDVSDLTEVILQWGPCR